MISIYNRYSAYGGAVRQYPTGKKETARRAPEKPAEPPRRPKAEAAEEERRDVMIRSGGLLRGLSLNSLDVSDIMLIAVLLLLYQDSRDEDFLIILGVLALSILRSDNRK